MADEQAFVDRTRSEVRTFLDAWETLLAAHNEYTRLGGNANADLDTVNYGDIDKTKFLAIMSSIEALEMTMGAGSGTNLYEGAA